MSGHRLTDAQWAALWVLVKDPDARMDSWTRSSTRGRTAELPLAPPRVNIRAVSRLVELGLARRYFAPSWQYSPYVNHDKFQITAEGLAAYEQRPLSAHV